jgi:tetratricopeptide (TPR) repeat protein
VSIGRVEHGIQLIGTLPFIDYGIYKVKDDKIVNMGLLKSEIIQLSHPRGHLGEGKYGVIHLVALPADDYYLVGFRRQSAEKTGIIFKFRIEPGKINYIGELLVVSKDLKNRESIKVGNQLERDFAFAIKSNPEASKEDVTVNLAERVNKTVESTNNADTYFNRGMDCINKGQYDQAISNFTKVLEINPKNDRAYNNRGNVYAIKGQYDKAILDYGKALEINPSNDEAYYNRGKVYLSKGQYDQAISDFTNAVKINPKNCDAYDNRGTVYAFKGEHDQAIADYNKALEIDSRHVNSYNNRGMVYRNKGDYDLAIVDFNKALEIDPSEGEVYSNRAIVYYLKGEYDDSWADVHRAQSLKHQVPLKFLDDLRKASGRPQ